METLNFTQFCIKYGYPCDLDTMFQAQLLGGRGLDGKVSKRSVSAQDERFHKMQSENKKAHDLFYSGVSNGSIIDASGELTKEKIFQRETMLNDEAAKSEINIIRGKISFIESLGSMSHMKNGKLKKGYQCQVDEYNERLNQLINKQYARTI